MISPSNLGTGTYDGLIDISDQSDFVTVSWTRYHDHQDSGLIGRSDSSAAAAEDAGKEHVTYDHDLFTNLRDGTADPLRDRPRPQQLLRHGGQLRRSPPPTAPTCGSKGATS